LADYDFLLGRALQQPELTRAHRDADDVCRRLTNAPPDSGNWRHIRE
jgi:hypothetical protein